ncbi:UrcA family protein [Croceicoccus mobilis]|uniref:UrcA family protein n=1 Tax=Croceicoccus mobilis TaxID=1703339 RepID=A0A916YSS7_9SPHN|nr:UrcA family protein [Croceicoccus mobilis]GGD58892.1 hypothetical protein GCM10010990_05250 [Croceicoccus mobilis]
MRKIALAVAMCGGLLASPALANPDTQEITVSVGDRSGNVQQRVALVSEIRDAAREVCTVGRVNKGPMNDRQKSCFRRAMIDARAQLADMERDRAMRSGG